MQPGATSAKTIAIASARRPRQFSDSRAAVEVVPDPPRKSGPYVGALETCRIFSLIGPVCVVRTIKLTKRRIPNRPNSEILWLGYLGVLRREVIVIIEFRGGTKRRISWVSSRDPINGPVIAVSVFL